MKTEKNTNKKASSDAKMPFDADAFIQEVSGAGSKEDTPIDLVEPEPPEEKPSKRKRSQAMAVDYETLFLSRNELRDRQGLYISRDNYRTLQTLVRAIHSERLSVSGLADNIIKHHIELYGDDINRIFDENFRKPI